MCSANKCLGTSVRTVTERVFYEHMSGEHMYATGGLPRQRAGYIDITCCGDVWFCLVAGGGGLVCFVCVCGR